MTARERLALVLDENENAGDETPAMEPGESTPDIAFQMRTSIRVLKLEKRLTLVEGQLRDLQSLESITKRHGR